jgi:2,5-diketo-D-gluconate reductase B
MIPQLSAQGVEMPIMGFGTSKLEHCGEIVATALKFGTSKLEHCGEIVATALKLGYRLIDTARKYGTEQGVGEAIRVSGVPRKEIFIATKVSHEDLHRDDFARSLDASLAALQVDYVDLLLVNWPSREVPMAETMDALAQARQRGLTRQIGVCNFNIALLKEAMRLCPEPLAVLQAEYHPYLDQSRLLSFCSETRLIFMAYCTVRHKRLMTDPVLAEIARSKGKTNAQIALRWLIQQGNIAPIPRSANPRHVAENIDVFDFSLSDDEMKTISALKRADGRLSSPKQAPTWD